MLTHGDVAWTPPLLLLLSLRDRHTAPAAHPATRRGATAHAARETGRRTARLRACRIWSLDVRLASSVFACLQQRRPTPIADRQRPKGKANAMASCRASSAQKCSTGHLGLVV